MDKPTACSIDKPYIFISYAHADKDRVYPFILELQKTYNVWYDDGMRYGEEDYVEFIMDKIDGCTVFLYMVSLNSVKSDFCKKEIRYAKNENKPFINIIMDGNDGSKDYKRFDFDYGLNQNVILSNFTSIGDAFIDMYNRSKDDIKEAFDKCHIEIVNPTDEDESVNKDDKIIDTDNRNQIFISFHKADYKAAEPIIERLEEKYNVWYDDNFNRHFEIGNLIKEEMSKSLIIIMLISSAYVDSKNKYFEVSIANEIKNKILFYPIEIEKVRYLGLIDGFLESYQPYKLYESNIDELLNKLSSIDIFNKCLLPEKAIDNIDDYDHSLYKIRKDRLIKYTGLESKVIIPNIVKSIGNDSFSDNRYIEEVIIPEGVVEISNMAFNNCSSLKIIHLPNSLKLIDKFAFANCHSLKDISFNDGLEEIGGYVFWNCSNITSLFIPKTVITINSYAFDEMESLESIEVDPDNDYYSSKMGVLFNKDHRALIKYPSNKKNSFYLIESSTVVIKTLAFHKCNHLEFLIVGTDDLFINTEAFKNNDNLYSLSIRGSIHRIESRGFSNSSPKKIKVSSVPLFNKTALEKDSFYVKREQGMEVRKTTIPVYDNNDRIVSSIKIKVSVF